MEALMLGLPKWKALAREELETLRGEHGFFAFLMSVLMWGLSGGIIVGGLMALTLLWVKP
jgi:hypothetical protein